MRACPRAAEGVVPYDRDETGGRFVNRPYGELEPFRPHVGAGLVPARRGNLGDTETPGESVPPGGVPRGALPSWAFELGWVSGGEEIAIFPSRGSFLFGSFSLDKQRERISSLLAFAEAAGEPRSYRAGGDQPRPYELNARFRSIETGRWGRSKTEGSPIAPSGHFPQWGKQGPPGSGPTRAAAPTKGTVKRRVKSEELWCRCATITICRLRRHMISSHNSEFPLSTAH